MCSAQGGNEADYRLLLGEIGDVATRYLQRRFGHPVFLEDCVQDILIAVHQARHTYDPCRPFRAWVFAIIRHKAIDCLRKHKRRQQLDEQLVQRPDNIETTAGPGEQLAQGELLQCLAQPLRDAVVLTKVIGLSSTEAASRLQISEGALKVRVFRALRKLQHELNKDTL